ncbi:hypothetical protein RUND412_006703 [Rhizina undulata]
MTSTVLPTVVAPDQNPSTSEETATTQPRTIHNRASTRRSLQFFSSDSTPRRHRSPSAVAKKLLVSSRASFSSRKAPPQPSSEMPLGLDRAMGGGTSGIPSHTIGLTHNPPTNNGSCRSESSRSTHQRSISCGAPSPLTSEKPQASTSGGAVTMTIQLAEPMLFLQGFDQNDHQQRAPAMLRGSLILRVAKASKIRAITLSFRGRARTEWPEGIPPKKSEYFEEKDIMQHIWPFFNAQFQTAEISHCADSYRLHKSSLTESSSLGSAIGHLARTASPIGLATASGNADHRLSLQLAQSRSFGKGDSPNGVSVAQRGYRVFQPGDYIYNFELPLENCLPETIDADLGSVKYELEGTIERPGAFRPNLVGKKDVVLIRIPAETSLECTEPIAISRTWEDQLHYDIVISGKSFPLGGTIPVAFKLTPLAKVRCHRIKIFITENIEYSCKNKKVHRLDPTRKVQLFEKRAGYHSTSTFAGSSARIVSGGGLDENELRNGRDIDSMNCTENLLGDLNGELNAGPTEMEFMVKLPGCNAKEKDRIHFDTTFQNIQVHHWIKIVMRLSKADPNDPTKRRHFEISIDSPFHVLSCRATQANTSLPAYDSAQTGGPAPAGPCSCPPLARRASPRDGTPTGATSVQQSRNPTQTDPNDIPLRPIHLIRHPSFNPPPFDYDVAPPPIITPPPNYDSVVNGSPAEGLADYFARLADETHADDESEDDSPASHGRLLPPLTPGGRVARSMDERRTWDPING